MNFASDNSAPVHPDIMAAMARANEGYAMPYGNDALMDDVRTRVRDIFEAPEAVVYLVATGTTANVLSLACQTQPWQVIYCHHDAHIQNDECGAPEFFTGGAKLVPLAGPDAKINPQALEAEILATQQGVVHSVQRGALSITNATEAGTVYTVPEVTALCNLAHAHDIPVHMDGARFANALVAGNASAADMTWRAGVDILSFGATKNGAMGVEAVVMFDPKMAWEFELRRKRSGHLFSKHRFLSAQMLGYLTNDLWIRLATDANRAAARLSGGIQDIPGATLIHPTQANAVFAKWPAASHRNAKEAGAEYYLWPKDASSDGTQDETQDENLAARMVCSWSTTDQDIDQFLDLIRG